MSLRRDNRKKVSEMDPKLIQAVLDEHWEAGGLRPRIIAVHIAADSTPGSSAVLERNRQAALGHRALRLLVNGSAVWSSVEDADEVRAIREELRGGK